MTGYVFDSHLTNDTTGFVLDEIEVGTPDVTLLWDFDTANIDADIFSIDWTNASEPVINLKVRLTGYDGQSNPPLRFIHFLFGLSGVQGLRPVFIIDITNRHITSTYDSSWRPVFNYDRDDADSWVYAPSFTPISSPERVQFQFTNAFTENTVYVADHQPYTVARFSELANSLSSDLSGLVSPSSAATSAGVIGTSPAEVDERGRQIGQHDLYGFVLSNGQPPPDGSQKRKMIVDCGIHSGEVLDGWPLEGLISFFLDGTGSAADWIRNYWDIGIYFCLTPNGRYGGHMRTNFERGKDPNRDWGGSGAFSLAESVIVRDAMLADFGSADIDVAIAMHTASSRIGPEHIYRYMSLPDHTVQDAWLNALDDVDGFTWNRVNTDISSSTSAWYASRGARVATISEFGTRGTATVQRYRETGQRYLEATAKIDQEGMFYDILEIPENNFAKRAIMMGL